MAGSTAVNTVIMIITTFFSKVLGFARELTLSYVYGASTVSDAYLVAFSIPTTLISGIGTAILTAYIAIYTKIQKEKPQELQEFGNKVMTMTFLLAALILAVFWVLARPIVKIFAVGFPEDTLAMTIALSRVMMCSVLFINTYFILQGYLQIHGKFMVVGLVSVPLNIFVILFIILSSGRSHMLLSVGVVLGYFFSFLMLYIAAKQCGYSFQPQLDLRDREIRALMLMVFPIFLGKTINQINTMIDRTIASSLTTGTVSALAYGNRITGFVTSVFVVALTTALFPSLSRLSAEKSIGKIKRSFRDSVGIMSLLVLPISAGMMVFSQEIVKLMFERGAFTTYDTVRTSQVLFYYSIGLFFFSVKEVTINVFYALRNTRTPTINSMIAILINIVLNLLLIKKMEHSGLALATSVSGAVTMLMLLISLRRQIGKLGIQCLVISWIKMLVSTLVMAAAVRPVYELIYARSEIMLLAFGAAVLVGVLIYGVANILLRTREMGMLIVGVAEKFSSLSRRH